MTSFIVHDINNNGRIIVGDKIHLYNGFSYKFKHFLVNKQYILFWIFLVSNELAVNTIKIIMMIFYRFKRTDYKLCCTNKQMAVTVGTYCSCNCLKINFYITVSVKLSMLLIQSGILLDMWQKWILYRFIWKKRINCKLLHISGC